MDLIKECAEYAPRVELRKHWDKLSGSLMQVENSRPIEQSSAAEGEAISLSYLVRNKDAIINRN
jgi:hypothetical protein